MIDIVIVNYHGYDITENLINSILNVTTNSEYQIYVVDNSHNEPEFKKFIKKFWKSNMKFINNTTENTSFCFAVNLVLRASPNDVIIMNNDNIIEDPDWINKMHNLLYSKGNLGMVELVPTGTIWEKMYWEQGRQQPFGIFVPSYININSKDRISTTVAMIKNECLKMVGVMDDKNFPFGSGDSDVDYCLRLKLCGYEVDTVFAKCKHLGSVDTKQAFGKKIPGMMLQTKNNFNRKWKHLWIYKT